MRGEASMKVGFYQFDVQYGEKEKNLQKVIDTLVKNDFDLIVLPELFTTGYLFPSKEEAISYGELVPEGKTTKKLIEFAQEKKTYIIGSIVELEDDGVYNTAIVVGPEGFVGKYRKIHLTNFELPLFDRGNEVPIFDIEGVKIGIAICFDCWFPELCRDLALRGADIICHPSNFGGTMSLDVIKVRAAENVLYTITANRIGLEHGPGFDAEFCGHSQIISPDSKVLYQEGNQESIFITEIDPYRSREKRNIICSNLYGELEFYKSHCKEK